VYGRVVKFCFSQFLSWTNSLRSVFPEPSPIIIKTHITYIAITQWMGIDSSRRTGGNCLF
jgi:hypothetical protein